MGKKTFKRVYRKEKLSPAEVTRDQEIRRKIMMEFPPLEREAVPPVLSDPLKEAIAGSDKTLCQLAKEANVSHVVLKQFMAGERDLRLSTAEKLAHTLGLKLVAN